jgi:hypothetical protein
VTTLRLGLRLAVAGGPESRLRLAVTAFGVGVGVLLLLLSLTGQSAAQGRADRSGWRSADPDTPPAAPDPALFLSVTDYHEGRAMSRAYVAALGDRPPLPPGLDRLPGPGEVAVSPAMRRLLEATPDDQLDDRYPGRIVATIGSEGLAHPDELVALVGRAPEQLRDVRSTSLHTVRGFDSLPSGYAYDLIFRAFLLVGTALLVVPVVIFIVMATRVAAAQREQRLAALRLAGATRGQAAVVAAVESGLGAAAGSVLGWAGYEVGRRVLAATVTFQGGHFWLDDVVVGRWTLLAVLVGVPVLAVLTTVATLRRVQVGPLAASRRVERRRLSARYALPLALVLAGPLFLAVVPGGTSESTLDTLAPVVVIATFVAFVLAGPWLCQLAGRALAQVSRRVPGLIAARRLAGDPRATFRAVSGVVLAAFAVTYAASLIDRSAEPTFGDVTGVLRPGVVEVYTGGVPDQDVAPLLAPPAVAARFDVGNPGEVVESCRELARVVEVSCREGDLPDAVTVRPGAAESGLAVFRIFIPTDGSPAAVNRARTEAASVIPNAIVHTQEDRVDVDARAVGELAQVMRLAWSFVLVVAACSLVVGMLAGLVERRRPFALLRASGLRIGELRRVVFLETAVAMLGTAVVGVALGLASSYVLAVFRDLHWSWPDAGVFAMVGAGVLVALVLTTLALPLVDVATRHDAVRYE